MPMPPVEYNRSRPGSALGTTYASNNAGSSRSSSVVGASKTVTGAQSRPALDDDYESDDLDFEAYKKSRFPNAATESKSGRTTTTLGMATTIEQGSNEVLVAAANSNENLTRSRNSSSVSTTTGASSTGPRRLENMRRALEARSSTTQPSRTPGLPNGRLTHLRGISESSTPARDSSKISTTSSISPVDQVNSSNPSSTVTIKQATSSSPRPALSRSISAASQSGPPGSPGSSSASSDGGDLSIDMGSFENGIAARKHHRLLEEKLGRMMDSYRKDPRNAGLSDADFNQGVNAIELEDPEERLLYKELRNYVKKGGELGPHWEKYCATRDKGGLLGDDAEDEVEEDLDDILNQPDLDEGEGDSGGQPTGKYHDALEEPHAEVVDLASFEETSRERTRSNERPSHGRLRSITTSDLPSGGGPLSAGSSSTGSRVPAHMSTSPEDRFPPPARSSSAAGHRPPNSSSLQYQTDFRASHQPHPQPREEEEEDVPIQPSKFQNLHINDTLQLRQQRTPWSTSTLPPDTVVYEPPPPPARSTRNINRSPDGGKTPRERQTSSISSIQPPAAANKGKRFNSSHTTHTQSTAQSQAHQQRLTKSAGKRPVEKRDYGSGGVEDRQVGGGVPRPNSSKGIRGEEERDEANVDLGGQGYNGVGRPGMAQSHAYQEPWQQQQQQHPNYYGATVRGPQTAPAMGNGGQYYSEQNGPYGGQGRSSSPIEHERQGRSMNPAHIDRTPGPTNAKANLARSNTVPASGSSLVGPDMQKNVLTVNKHQYIRLEQIGRGGTSKVYRVIRLRDWRQFALKKIAVKELDDQAMRSYVTEIQMLKRLSGNASVVRLFDDELRGDTKSGTLYLVMELGETDFSKLLEQRQGTPISLPWITLYFKQMLDAVRVIHEERIVHSDLKPANFVLIGNSLKLIDFGIAKAIANDTTNIHREDQIGTVNYMSPEAFNSAPGEDRYKIGRPSDVWSLGCILYQMVYGHAPFYSLPLQQKLFAISRGDYIIPFPEYSIPMAPKEKGGKPEPREHLKVKVPMDLIVTMQNCLNRQANMRPTTTQLLQEPWLEGIYDRGQSSGPELAEDEAVISKLYMAQLIHYCFRSYDPTWDDEDVENVDRVESMVDQVMPQLQQLRPQQ